MATTPDIRDVTLETFQQSVIEESSRRPVAVDFWAAWCGPCRILGPTLERLADEFGGDFLLAKVDTEAEPELAQHFAIRSIPQVKLFRDGRVVDTLMGAVGEAEARRFLRQYCPTRADRRYEEGIAALAAGDTARARNTLEQALAEDASHAGALLELGKLAAAAGDAEGAVALWRRVPASSPRWDEARTLESSSEFHVRCAEAGGMDAIRARVASDPRDLGARYALACCLAARGQYREALEEFLAVVARDNKFQDEAARRAMLTVFSLVGERSDVAEEYRKRLALVLF